MLLSLREEFQTSSIGTLLAPLIRITHTSPFSSSAGGMYTTANDLAKFVNKVILAPESQILTNEQVRQWLAPLYVFSDRKTAVGYPLARTFSQQNAMGNFSTLRHHSAPPLLQSRRSSRPYLPPSNLPRSAIRRDSLRLWTRSQRARSRP